MCTMHHVSGAGLRLMRILLMAGAVLDAGLSALVWASGSDAAGDFHPLYLAIVPLSLVVVAALLWWWPRVIFAAGLVVGVLNLWVGLTGLEAWVLAIGGVVLGARASRRTIVVTIAVFATFCLGYGLRFAGQMPIPVWGIAVVVFSLPAVPSLLVGFVVRLVRRRRLGQQAVVAELAEENERIRTIERERLAAELHRMVTDGLTGIDGRLAASAHRTPAPDVLTGVEHTARGVLDQLRALLNTLRAPVAAAPEPVTTLPWYARWQWGRLRLVLAGCLTVLALSTPWWHQVGSVSAGVAQLAAVPLLAALALWRPLPATVAAGLLVLVGFAQAPPYLNTGAAGLVVGVSLAVRGPAILKYVVPVFLAYLAVNGVLAGVRWVSFTYVSFYYGEVCLAGGLAAHHYSELRRELTARAQALRGERPGIVRGERKAVARDLHDVVGHQLTQIILTAATSRRAADPELHRRALEAIHEANSAAKTELRAMMREMGGPDQAAPAVVPHSLAEVAVRVRDDLGGHGFQPRLDVDEDVHALDPTILRTLTRALQECATNITRHAEPASVCALTLRLGESGAELRAVSLLPRDPHSSSDLSSGWGLRGLRERVDLLGGSFHAGPRDDRWLVRLSVPAVPGQQPDGGFT